MKIAVCVKQVPYTGGSRQVDPGTKRLDRSGEAVLNPFDANAIEEALRIKEAAGEGEVVLVTLGPERAGDVLKKGLAMGADGAVHVADPAAEGSDLVATSYVLAAVLERENPDLVLFGQQASDSDGAVLCAAVAARLQRPLISQVSKLTVEGRTVRGTRQTEFGYDTIEAPLPVVVAVSDAINEPRYATLRGIRGAATKRQQTLSLEELGADPERVGDRGSRTVVLALGEPPQGARSQQIHDDGSAAEKLIELLAERKLV